MAIIKVRDYVTNSSVSFYLTFILGYVQTKLFPTGEKELEFEYPYKKYVEVSWTSDEAYLVCYGCEKQNYHLYVHSAKSGKLVHKFHVKYDGFKVSRDLLMVSIICTLKYVAPLGNTVHGGSP